MHGIIFSELKQYVVSRLGAAAWGTLLEKAGMPGRVFMPGQEYPDADAVALVSTASAIIGEPAQGILEDFGEFIAPALMEMYGSLIPKEWRTLDVIEHTEETIHTVVRRRNPGAHPPELRCQRLDPDEVVVVYSSPRKMCAVAKGIARGMARHFKETVTVSERSCMLAGARECRISVQRQPSPPPEGRARFF
jgi:predicted hydrocarbon binding protein